MLSQDAATLEKLPTINAIWAGAQRALAARGICFLNYLTVENDFTAPHLLTNIPQIYGAQPPQQDPFLSHCCESYQITLTGVAYLPDYQYLPPEAQRFIQEARSTGFQTGLGIPMRLRGSDRFGGFNLGTRLTRDAFEARVLPMQEELRSFCLILHRRIEEIHFHRPLSTSGDAFRSLMIAPDQVGLGDLTAREQEVAYLVASGLSRKECARLCGISPHTVSDYVKAVYRKLGVNNRVHLARLFEDHGGIPPIQGDGRQKAK